MLKQDKDYDSEPVTYCAKCYSLNIRYEDSIGMDCCGKCGCTDFLTSSYDEWEKKFKERYGHKLIEEKGDIKKSPIFQMTNTQLKKELIKCPSWKLVCRNLYPNFPNWLDKADSIILLFAKLYKDNRIDELKMELIKQDKKRRYGKANQNN